MEEEFRNLLIKTGALKFGDFILKSGKRSRYYIDMRTAFSHPDILELVSRAAADKIAGLEFDSYLAIPMGGIPLAVALSLKTGYRYGYLRKERKEHGLKKMVEGDVSQDDRLLLVDDVLTTGSSIASALELLEREGYHARTVLVAVDREEGGRENLEGMGLRVISVFPVGKFISRDTSP